MFYRLGKKKERKTLEMGGDNHPHGRPRVKKWIRAAFNFIALIPFRLIRQTFPICFGAQF